MAFQKKYYYKFGDINNQSYIVELWQNTGATLTAEEVRSAEIPFNVTYPKTTKLEVVRGSGCDLSLLSTSSMKFLNLYTVDSQEYQIKLLSGTTLLWIGYLDSELYSEPFSYKDNYSVALTGNDGLAQLDNMYYIINSATTYTGFTSLWTVIKNVLGKLSLSWNNVYVGLSTTSSELVAGNILEQIYTYNENYYDEDEQAMTCRQVLESVLQPFAAHIKIVNANVYITDNHNLVESTSKTFYKYSGTDFSYIGTQSITLNLGDVSTIKFVSDEQTLNVIPPINKQIITFSPYINDKLIEYKADDDLFSSQVATQYYGTYPYTSTQITYSESQYWTGEGLPVFGELTGTGDNAGIKEKYLIVSDSGSYPNLIIYNKTLPNIITTSENVNNYNFCGDWIGNMYDESIYYYSAGDVVTYNSIYYLCTYSHYPADNDPPPNASFELTSESILDPPTAKLYFLKIESKAYIRTNNNYGGDSSYDVRRANVYCKLKVGNYKYSSTTNSWVSGATNDEASQFALSYKNANENIADKWVSSSDSYNSEIAYQIVPLYGFIGNNLQFTISDYKVFGTTNNNISSSINDIRLKELKFTVVDSQYNEISNTDIEYTVYVNKNVKSDGDDITLVCGTNYNEIPYSKGALLKYTGGNYWFIKSFTRASLTGYVEELLGRSIRSNNPTKTLEIVCKINKIDSLFGYLTYSNHLTGKFGIQGAVIDYGDSSIELTLQQLFVDSGDIQKNY